MDEKPCRRVSRVSWQYGRAAIVTASCNVNLIGHVGELMDEVEAQNPDVLLLQELKGNEFPFDVLSTVGYESIAVTQKAYNGVAILSRSPIESVSKRL